MHPHSIGEHRMRTGRVAIEVEHRDGLLMPLGRHRSGRAGGRRYVPQSRRFDGIRRAQPSPDADADDAQPEDDAQHRQAPAPSSDRFRR